MTIYHDLGVEPIINAAGTHTRLGGSLIHPEVMDAMAAASRAFVDMDELHLAAGRRLAGGAFVEVEPAAAALAHLLAERDDLAGVSYSLAWFLPGPCLPLAQVAELAHAAGLPLIVDAAAQIPPLENLTRFVGEGADLVAYSGGKALRGPQSAGLIVGRADLIEACRLNDSPHYGVGRPMKAGKEDIVGLMRAVELYLARDHAAEMAVWERRLATVLAALADLPHVQARRQMPESLGMQVPHGVITWDQAALGLTYAQAVAALRGGRPRIDVTWIIPQRYPEFEQEQLRVGPHTLREGEEYVVARRLREVLGGA